MKFVLYFVILSISRFMYDRQKESRFFFTEFAPFKKLQIGHCLVTVYVKKEEDFQLYSIQYVVYLNKT